MQSHPLDTLPTIHRLYGSIEGHRVSERLLKQSAREETEKKPPSNSLMSGDHNDARHLSEKQNEAPPSRHNL